MKYLFLTILFIITATTSFAQSLDYKRLALLFSEDEGNGSARFVGMSGAFGAVGGDISAMNINPAGIAVYKNSAFSGTINTRNTATTSNYYNTSTTAQEGFLNISQAGAVLVFDSANNSKWTKFAVGFNYRITKDFNNDFFAQGNSGIATFTNSPIDENDPILVYDTAVEQHFSNTMKGELSEINMVFSSVYGGKLYVGGGLNFYDLNFNQQTLLTEFNNTSDDQELDAELYQENNTLGTGVSLNAGFIYRVPKGIRIGLAYQTPTWFSEILQDTNYGFDSNNDIDTNLLQGETTYYTEGQNPYTESNDWQYIAYRLKTPSKLTASAAFIFGRVGLLSIDYTTKNYKKIKLSNGFFSNDNQFFNTNLRNTHNLNIGTEWRFNRVSLRGGYKFEQTPLKNASNLENIDGYSFGGGYHFGNKKIDLSYSNSNRKNSYNFYSQFNNINAAAITTDNRTITATLTLKL